MRWSNLTLTAEEQRRLPGYRDEALVRRFDAPEALDTRFYEVRARSILNRVPRASRMPFRWTINPYRGCTHACVYCLWGGTPILMGDGRQRKLAEVEVGEEIYGTVAHAGTRRFEHTVVLAKWTSVRRAHRVTLADGTKLIASADHRFLTERGWKHVAERERSAPRRPHLSTADAIIGLGRFAASPAQDRGYRRGYLCGLIRGAGELDPRAQRETRGLDCDGERLQCAFRDPEARGRAHEFLRAEGVDLGEPELSGAPSRRGEPSATRPRGLALERISALIGWPELASVAWCRGFLAGSFDAAGSRSAGALRIAGADPVMARRSEAALQRLGFDAARDPARAGNGIAPVRVNGGLSEHLRFLLLCDPAISAKRSIAGEIVKPFSDLRVVQVEDLRMRIPMFDVTTGTGDFIADGVVSHNCFARPTHRYLDFDARRDFEREIVVKVNAPEALRAELARPTWEGEHVALGTNTDPYQWVEGRYKLMSGIWEAMRDAAGGAGNPCSILTKSPLLLRDLALMRQIAAKTSFSASLSIPTLDQRAWRETEPHTPNPKARLEAVAELSRAGIRTGILIAPLMPGINDSPEQLEPLIAAAIEAGAKSVNGIALHLRGEVRAVFMEWLREQRPELVDFYEELYRERAYAPAAERARLSALVREHTDRAGHPGAPRGQERIRGARPVHPEQGAAVRRATEPPPETGQEQLF